MLNFRLRPGGEVRLKYAYIIKCDEVVKDANGEFTLKTVALVLKDHQDRYAGKCPMKW